MTRLNVGEARLVTQEKKGIRRKLAPVVHTYVATLMLDEKGAVEGGLVVEKETDREWILVEAHLLRK